MNLADSSHIHAAAGRGPEFKVYWLQYADNGPAPGLIDMTAKTYPADSGFNIDNVSALQFIFTFGLASRGIERVVDVLAQMTKSRMTSKIFRIRKME